MIELEQFLVEANKNGYASGNMGTKNEDGSRTIKYPPEGDIDGWRFEDRFYGGEPYGGQEVIFKDGKPHWTMVYYGFVQEGEDPGKVYPFLQKALLLPDRPLPVRGPTQFIDKPLRYNNSWRGDLSRFKGQESISTSIEHIIYEAWYAGGIVDQRQE